MFYTIRKTLLCLQSLVYTSDFDTSYTTTLRKVTELKSRLKQIMLTLQL